MTGIDSKNYWDNDDIKKIGKARAAEQEQRIAFRKGLEEYRNKGVLSQLRGVAGGAILLILAGTGIAYGIHKATSDSSTPTSSVPSLSPTDSKSPNSLEKQDSDDNGVGGAPDSGDGDPDDNNNEDKNALNH